MDRSHAATISAVWPTALRAPVLGLASPPFEEERSPCSDGRVLCHRDAATSSAALALARPRGGVGSASLSGTTIRARTLGLFAVSAPLLGHEAGQRGFLFARPSLRARPPGGQDRQTARTRRHTRPGPLRLPRPRRRPGVYRRRRDPERATRRGVSGHDSDEVTKAYNKRTSRRGVAEHAAR